MVVVLLAGAQDARAEVALAGDVDIGIPVAQGPVRYLATGAGFDFRLGYRFRVPYQHITVVPEVVAGFTDLSAHLVRIRPGLRVGIGRLLIPYSYAHIGWAYASFDPLGAEDTHVTTLQVSAQGLSVDFGGGLDVTILRRLTVGAHLGYNVLLVGQTDHSPSYGAKWMSLGLNATFYL